MKISFRLSSLCFGLLITLITCWSTPAAAVPKRIIALLEDAKTETTIDLVDKKLDEANQLADRIKDEIDSVLTQAYIKQISGYVYIEWGQRPNNANLYDKGYDSLLQASDSFERLFKLLEVNENESLEKIQKRRKPAKDRLEQIENKKNDAKYRWALAELDVACVSNNRIERENHFTKALEKFSEFTEQGDPNQIPIATCFVGQAQCLCELKRYSEAAELLDPEKFTPENIKSKNKEEIKDIFKRTTLWRMKAYQELDNHQMAEDAAKRYFDTLPENSKLDDMELEMLIMRVPSLGALYNNDQSLQARCSELNNLIEPYGDWWLAKLAAELDKLGIKTPHWYLSEAKNNLKARNFKEAIDYAETGLKEGNSEGQLGANLRHIKFEAFYRLNQWRQAYLSAREFLEHHPKDSRANEVCGWAIKSGRKALDSDPPLETGSFLRFIEDTEKNFPENSEAQNIPWYKGYVLFLDGQYPNSQEMLEQVELNSQFYNQAQYFLALACYKQAKASIEAGENKQEDISKLLGDTVAALDRLAQNLPEGEHQLSRPSVTLAIETSRCLLNLNPPDPEKVLYLIDKMQKIQDAVHQSEDQWLTQLIKANLLTGDINSSIKLIETLPEKAATANSLIEISKMLERTSKLLTENNKGPEAESVDKKLLMVYRTLFENYISKSTDEQIRANEPSVRVLMANCYLRLHEYDQAIGHYEWYMNNVPQGKRPDVTRSLAIAYEQTENYDSAVQQWWTLYRSLKRRTNEWIEAGYHLIFCDIRAGNREHARKLLEQFELLCPRSEMGEWGQKFDVLKKELLPANISPEP